jgi:hypothetical protein
MNYFVRLQKENGRDDGPGKFSVFAYPGVGGGRRVVGF